MFHLYASPASPTSGKKKLLEMYVTNLKVVKILKLMKYSMKQSFQYMVEMGYGAMLINIIMREIMY